MGAIGGEDMLHWEKMQRQDSSSSGAGAPGIGDGGGGERICVSVRLRPLNEKEIARSDVSDWECIDDQTIMFRNSLPERSMFPSAYTFDRVFRCDCSTRQVYEEAAKQVALSVVSGINSSIFAYGQTSSGKTYTMTGITDYTIADIYDYIQKHGERAFVLKFSAIEIYNEAVRDLLNPDGAQLRLLDDPDKGTIVEKLTEETLRGWNHMKELLSICEAQRQIGETSLNEASSRSHQILRLTVESSAREFLGKDNSSTLAASVNFVDLAGSERASQALSAGTRLKEGCHINRSLLTLGTVIRKLSKGRNTHIPYRDSKLTRILQPSLGGNGRTAIICTMSPARSHLEQSRNTLLFACCAKQVTTNAQVNIVVSDKVLVKHLQKELARLESELRNTGAPSVTSRSSDALLREKDAQILKMERVIQELSEQRDLVQSQLHDLLRVVGDNHTTRLWEFGDPPPFHDLNQYDDNLSVSESSGVIDQSPDFGFKYLSSSNKDENFLLSSELQKQHGESSPRIAADVSSFAESDPQRGVEISYGNRENDFLEPCKDVECIEVEELSHCRNNNNSASLPGDDEEFLPSIDTKNTAEMIELASEPNAKVDREVIELEQRPNVKLEKEVREQGSDTNEKTDRNSKHIGRDVTYDPLEQQLHNVQKPLINFVRLLPDEPSPWTQSYLRRSRSCRASLMNNITSFWFEHSEQNENTPPSQFVKDFPPIPKAFERRPCSLNYRSEVRTLSRADSHASEQSVSPDVPKPRSTDEGSEESITSIYSCVADVKETAQGEYDDQAISCQETEQKGDVNIGQPKILKDVGLDPMQITTSPSSPMTFESQQEKIIMLWHENNVPLKHRSTFFLLFFNGDPADAIYMEVELRTQSFLKKAFSGDNVTRRNGPIITRASSLRALRRERERLSRRMETRLTPEEREDLYKQCGIGLDTKQRKLQLAHRLWADPNNMEHIKESVALVKKLEGLFEFGEPSKEMFGLSFSPQMRRRSFSWKNGMSSLL